MEELGDGLKQIKAQIGAPIATDTVGECATGHLTQGMTNN